MSPLCSPSSHISPHNSVSGGKATVICFVSPKTLTFFALADLLRVHLFVSALFSLFANLPTNFSNKLDFSVFFFLSFSLYVICTALCSFLTLVVCSGFCFVKYFNTRTHKINYRQRETSSIRAVRRHRQ